ncbi:hypothetical protein [Streptomyces sp. BPSDS2]|uniref:hypothetical protein n=1 Tax=Streptomyces sp. BPSDS2 TaxID=2571021 RepID=UPI0010C1662B|nr:hypothetical protein [Streptomyces sp. BPSDS2]
MMTKTRNTVVHPIPLGTARLRLLALGLARTAVPPLVAVVAAWAIAPQLNADGPARVAYLVLVAVVALSAVDNTLTNATERTYRRAYGRVHGPRSWSCEDCGHQITAREWTPYDAAVFETHLADPRAHGCTHS